MNQYCKALHEAVSPSHPPTGISAGPHARPLNFVANCSLPAAAHGSCDPVFVGLVAIIHTM